MTNPYDNTALDVNTAPLWTDPSGFAPSTQDDTPNPIVADGRPAVRAVYAALWGYLRRPLKVIDLGHSPHRQHFPYFIMDPGSATVWPDSCDLVLCSVPRQDENGRVREVLLDAARSCAKRVGVLLFETVWDDRTAGQRDELPGELKYLRSSFAFVHTVSESDEGSTPGRRVLLFCSNRYWYTDGHMGAFDSWTPYAHEMAGENRKGSRRYFSSVDKITKHYHFYGISAQENLRDLEREISFLSRPPIGGKSIPRLFAHHVSSRDGVVVMERLPGILLTTAILREERYDPALVLQDVLERLGALERVGLYHGDVGPWNVLIYNNGGAALIDFASITKARRTCYWPYDPILNFLIFAQGVIHRRPRSLSIDQLLLRPFRFPRPFRRWAAFFWKYPPEQRNFTLLKTCLEAAVGNRPQNHRRPGISGRLLRSYRLFFYWRALIGLQMCFLMEWVKQGGLRMTVGRILGFMIRSFTARPVTALPSIGCRNPLE
jgi:hypothetical protein